MYVCTYKYMPETSGNCKDISSNWACFIPVSGFNCAKYGSCVESFCKDTVDMKLNFIDVIFI